MSKNENTKDTIETLVDELDEWVDAGLDAFDKVVLGYGLDEDDCEDEEE